MKPVAPRKSLARQIAEDSTRHVLMESTRAAIEKMAEEFAREAMADPEFRAYLRREVATAARELLASLKAADPEVHGPERGV
jgi:pantoate kinase